jgi:hypothetical protein
MQNNSPPKRSNVSGRIVRAVCVAVIVLLVLWVRVFYGSMKDYETGEMLLKENQIIRAITYFDRSLHWYAPLNPYLERAATRLWEIGEKAEKAKDKRLALIAYESIRNGFYGATHFVTPGKHWIRKVDAKLASLNRGQTENRETPQASAFSGESRYPSSFWSAVVVIGFLGWIGSLIGLITATFRQGGDRGGKGILWLGSSLLCFILWLVGMTNA